MQRHYGDRAAVAHLEPRGPRFPLSTGPLPSEHRPLFHFTNACVTLPCVFSSQRRRLFLCPFFFNLLDPPPLLAAVLFPPTGRLSLHFFPPLLTLNLLVVHDLYTDPAVMGGPRGSCGTANLGKWPAQKWSLFSQPVGLATWPANCLLRKTKPLQKRKAMVCL